MKKIHMIAALLAMLLPTVLWGNSTTYYYAALKAQVSSTGGGKVYAGTSKSAPAASNYKADSSTSSTQSSTTENEEKSFYAFAQADDVHEFSHWATTDGGESVSKANPYEVKVKCSSSNESNPTSKEVYAIFNTKKLTAFDITFETSDAGTYTVNGAAPPADGMPNLEEVTSVILKSTDPNFLSWNVGGTTVSDNPHTATCIAATTISANFLTADQVTTVTTYDELTAALANAQYVKITIPGGKEITVAKGATLTVPTGKQLVVDGTLVVVGSVSNSGTISGNGTLRKISYLISQSDVITPLQANGSECGRIKGASAAHATMARYHKTTVTANFPTVNGTIGCKEGWGVALNGNAFYAISKQSPAALKVTIDSTKDTSDTSCRYSVNKIASVVGGVDDITESSSFVLLSNFTLKLGIADKSNRSTFRGLVDCAGKTFTWSASNGGNKIAGSNSVFLNGVVKITPSSEYQNSQSTFFNCSEIQFQQVKGTSPEFAFYDCGTAATPTTVSFNSYNSGPTVVTHYFSGCYKYTFNTTYDNGHASVYGGSFTADPSNYIPASLKDDLENPVAAVYDGSKYYVVQIVRPAEKVVSVGGVEYETLEEAVAKASDGATISLIGGVNLTGKTVTFPAGKTLTLNLDKHIISGGKIVVENNATLLISDLSSANESTVGCQIENSGTLDFVFGKYTGSIVNKAGTLTVHSGIFTGSVTKDGGTVNLKGGNFGNDISALAEVEGVEVFRDGSYYCPCEVPDGTMRATTVSGASGYGIKPYSDSDYALMKSWVGGKTSRTDYSAADWQRLAELLCFYQVFNNNGIDPTLVFDRKVTADSLNLGTIPSSGSFAKIFFDVAAGKPYRALTETLMRYGPQMGYSGAAKTYSAIFKENISSVAVAVSDKVGENTGNAGTLCKTMIEIWEGEKVGSIRVTNTLFVAGQKITTIGAGSNLAMIRPATGAATFYETLGAAMDAAAAAHGGTVMLANDCTEGLALNKAGTYTFDTMGFAASDEVSVADGLFIKSSTSVDSSAKVLVPDAKATTYVVAQKVAGVGGQFYDNLAEAVEAANGAVVTLYAATEETITLTAEGQSFTLNKNGIAFDDAKVVTSIANGSVTKSVTDAGTVYTAVTSVVDASDGNKYVSVGAAVATVEGNDVSVTVTANVTEEVALPQGKTLTVKAAEGVEANVTVTPADGAFIVESAVEGGTKYESKKITVEMKEPVSAVAVTKVDNGTESDVTDAKEIAAAVAKMTGNNDVPRTDNTDKLDVLDKITVTPTKIVEEVKGGKTVIRSATFDVTPSLNVGQTLAEGQKLKFRLPVDTDATQLSAIAYHNAVQIGVYPVAAEKGEKFIEVAASDFSPYGYDLLDGETANPVAAIGTTGYATFADAITAANEAGVDEITILNGATESPDTDWKVADGKLVRKVYVAQIGTTKYETIDDLLVGLQTAIAGGSHANTITFLADVELADNFVIPQEMAQCPTTFDLNGKHITLAAGKTHAIRNFGQLTLVDSVGGGSVTAPIPVINESGATFNMQGGTLICNEQGRNAVQNRGTFNMTGGSLQVSYVGSSSDPFGSACLSNSGTATITKGSLTSVNQRAYAIVNSGTGTLTIDPAADSDVSVTGAHGAVAVDGGTVSISGGSYTATNYYALYVSNEASDPTVTVTGGTFDGNDYSAYIGSDVNESVTASVAISGGTFNDPIIENDKVADGSGFAISGGNFTTAVAEDYCATDYIPAAQDSETGMYTVKQGTYVAQIVRGGEVVAKYEAFDAALAEALSGDTVQLLADVTGVTTTYNIDKAVTIDGQGQYKIVAGENTTPRGIFESWGGGRSMFALKSSTANVTFKDLTIDGGEGHYYTYFVHVKSGTATFTDVELLRGGEADASGKAGVGYGAAILADGGNVVVSGSFYADTHGEALEEGETGDRTAGIFPFTAILYQGGGIHFDDGTTADIGQDLLLVGMQGALDLSDESAKAQVQDMLDAMNVPTGYVPYTLKVADNATTSFTGASPRGWNDIIDYGKGIMDVSSSLGIQMDKTTTPVEVGLVADTMLPDEFTYEDANFTINGNGNALSGTIVYTDGAGTMENVAMGTEQAPLVLDMTGLGDGKSINLGAGVSVDNVTIKVTEHQAASMGQTIITWNTEGETAEEAATFETINVAVVDSEGAPVTDPATGEAKVASVMWDAELGIGYIGPCEARLTGPTHDAPIYTSLKHAIELAEQTGDTVTLLMDIANVSGTYEIDKSITLDGAGYKVTAAPVTTHRDVVNAWAGSTAMFKLKTGDITFRNITLDGDATHAYTYLVSADNSTCSLTTENITLLHGGEIAGDANGAALQDGAGYGAAIHLNNGASLTVKDGFYADTHGAPAEAGQTIDKADGVFPFTGILPEGGSSVTFDLTKDSDATPTVAIGEDLLLVGMVGVIPHDQVQGILNYMKVPTRFIPYTLTLSDGSAYAFTGASPRTWNDIIDYGKDIMDVSTAIGYQGLDKKETPVEVGLLTDTVLPDTFTYQDANFSVNGNGNALSGTIVFTDDAEGGMLRNIKLGTEGKPLVLDLTQTTNAVDLGVAVTISDITVKMTEDQARLGKVVFDWDPESVTGDDVPNHGTVEVTVVDDQGGATGDTKSLVWDEEYGIAYIGPVEVRLSGPGKEPSYMDLTNAFDIAAGGDTITLFSSGVSLGEPVYLPAGTLLFATNKYELALGENAAVVFTNATTVFRSEMDLLSVLGLEGDVASGYILRTAVDNTTNVYTVVQRGEYHVVGTTEDGDVGTAVIKVADSWVVEHVGANVKTANQVETFLNSTNSATNLREWEMYVLNQTAPFRVTAVGKADNSVSTTLVDPASSETTGFTVAYSLDETLADGSVKTPGTRQASRDFAVPVASVTTHAFYRVRAHLTSGESTLVVDSANTIGVLKATATTAQTIVAVPWAAFGGGDVSVADLLRTDGLSADDELFVYNPSTQNFRAWTLGSGKTWEPTQVISAGDNATPGEDAASVTVSRGSGVLLKRVSVPATLCFVGEVASGGKTALGAAQTSGTDGAQSWNLVASPSVEALDIANFPAPSAGGCDRIVVLTSGAPLNLTYKNGKWGYNKVEVKNDMAVPTRVTEGVSIPAGVGFWYLNSGAAREIEW